MDNNEGNISDLPDEDLDEELSLPTVLANLSSTVKRELLLFKRAHNERDWEEEILRRQDLLTKKIDLERLKRMQNVPTQDFPMKKPRVTKIKALGKAKAPVLSDSESDEAPRSRRPVRAAKARSKPLFEEDDSDSFNTASEVESDDERVLSRHSDSDGSSDGANLFDSDEEEALSSKFKQPSLPKPLTKGRITEDSSVAGNEIDWGDDSGKESESGEDKRVPEDGDGGSRSVGGRQEAKVRSVDDKEAALEDYITIQLRRVQIEKWLREPFFEETVVNYYVRVLVGKQNGINVYRMGLVTAVDHGCRKYWTFDNSMMTNKRLVVDIAGNTKRCKTLDISNSKLSQGELDVYLAQIRSTRTLKPLTEKEAKDLRQAHLQIVDHTYTHDEVNEMVQRNRGMNKAVVTDYATALASLHKRRTKAIESNDVDDLDLVSKAIEKLEHEIQLEKEIVEKSSSFQYVSLNRRNKEANFQKDLNAGVKKRKLEQIAAVEGPASTSHDPFVRRETFGQNLWKTGIKLELEKLRLEREELLTEVKKIKSQGGNVVTVGELEAKAAVIMATLESKGYTDAKIVPKVSSSVNMEMQAGRRRAAVVIDNEETWKLGKVTLDEVRSKVARKLGVDPYAVSRLSARDRYLMRTCDGLPAPGQQRESLRQGVSLSVFMRKMIDGREQELNV